MKSKIALVFEKCKREKRPALITYTVAGDNTKDNSLRILNSKMFFKLQKNLKSLILKNH